MQRVHVVWDWNGTLFDDLDIVVESVSRSIARHGLPLLDADMYRDHYTRPVRSFYDSLFGRAVDDMEWEDLNKTFHELYFESVDRATLSLDAHAALKRVAELGWSQSLLSMSTHDELVRLVRAHGLKEYLSPVSGLTMANGDLKASYLRAHLAEAGISASNAVIVGDTPDDHLAASEVGARSVAYDGGSHHREVLDAIGVPVVDTLIGAVELIESWRGA